jgi:ATP-binding cassette subfamily B protein
MLKKLMPCLKGYGKYAILTPLCVIVEVLLEVYIPFLMADIINVGITNRDINHVLTTGGIMVVLSIVSLAMGALSGRFAALGSTGFASGVRKKLFARIQEFSFANIDKFSTASLVTRLTTDVTNAQVSFMMVTRMLARAPVMLICATIMALRINTELATVFLIAIPVLAIALAAMALIAYPRFQAMLKKYDSMNGQVQENLIAIRVVKTFVRGDHETKEFNEAAATLRKFSLKAERVLVLAMPLMQFVVYACMIAILWFGGTLVIGGTMMTGDLMSFITYVMQIAR